MEICLQESEFLDSFEKLIVIDIDRYGKNKMNLFILRVNANEFDYSVLEDNLLDPMIDYSLSRQVKKRYSNKPALLSKKARTKFLEYTKNKGELGELMLFCFLETHLKAPKILSKLELKTSTSHYVNGADGVHFLRLEDGNYQLIFGESKLYEDLTSALTDAFKSIYMFKNEINEKGEHKSGIKYEKSLISDNLLKETFDDEEKAFLEKLVYPKRDNGFYVDDAFGIFIGFQIDIPEEDKYLPNDIFRKKIYESIETVVRDKVSHIVSKISEYNLQGSNFYLYIIPFTNVSKTRKDVLEEVLK